MAAVNRTSAWLELRSRRMRSLLYRIFFWAGVLALVLLGIDQIRRIGDFRIDDAYITFSFSKNLAAGNGPVYSHGLRVEGYSNFLWMLALVPAFLVYPSGDGYVAARVLAFGLLAAGLYLVYRLARRGAGPLTALLAPACVLACSDVMRAALSGLETTAFWVAIVFGYWVYLKEPPTQRRWSLLAFVPAALLRIDGFVPLLIVMGFEGLHALVDRRFSLRGYARWAAPAVAIWAAYFAWRWAYYGLPLPTTYYAKSMVDAAEPGRGVEQLWNCLRDYGALALAPLLFLPLVRGPRRDAFALWTTLVLYLTYVGLTGGDWMPFHRFIQPAVPLGAVLAAWGTARLLDELDAASIRVRALGLAFVAAAFGFFGVHVHMGSVDTNQERAKLGEAAHVQRHTRENLLAGMDLARWVIRAPGERMVTDYAGVFAMFTDATVIDMWGLCNTDIALNGGIDGINPIYGKACAQCYARLDPHYFHVFVPLVRSANAFRSQSQIIDNVFQGHAIHRVIDLRRNFAAGRVVETKTGRAFWFLERRRPGIALVSREPAPGIRVEYPFERDAS